MTDEILSVVNENDEVIGQRSRRDIHRLGLLHRAVHIFIFNEKNELFLQLRSMSKDTNPGLWDSSAAGHVDVGEDYDDCALRETAEELAIRLAETPERLAKIQPCEKTGMEFIQVYRVFHNGPFQLNPEEIDEGRWIGIGQMDAWVDSDARFLTETIKYIWRILNK